MERDLALSSSSLERAESKVDREPAVLASPLETEGEVETGEHSSVQSS